MKKIAVLFGGKSTEHLVSLLSATSVLRAMDKTKFEPVMIGITEEGEWKLYEGDVDNIEKNEWEDKAKHIEVSDLPKLAEFALPIMHGIYGEDGTIQGLFEMLDMPYAGCGVLGSALAMDKIAAKMVFDRAGIPICKYEVVNPLAINEEEAKRIGDSLGFPCYVKPANMGSSVGIVVANKQEELLPAIKEALKYDRRILVEEGLNVHEIEVAVMGNDDPIASVAGEIVSANEEFYDYEAKYFSGGASTMVIPAEIPEEVSSKIRELARKAYMAIDCAGFSRCDFFWEKGTGRILINEINTIPGFTKFSMFPVLFENTGIPYAEQIERIIDFGYERYNSKNNRQTNI